jgi:Bacterial regulatory proteins, tetR family
MQSCLETHPIPNSRFSRNSVSFERECPALRSGVEFRASRLIFDGIEPDGSLLSIGVMGRTRKFNREGVLQKAIPVFWENGFDGTSVQDLELATGVNKSGLYAEFESKEDLFLASLRYYLEHGSGHKVLSAEPLGWANVEKYLKLAHGGSETERGCFSVNSMREVANLPP